MKNKIKLVVATMAASLVLSTGSVSAYTIDSTYQLGAGQGSSQRTNNRIIIAHDTGTYAPAVNNAIYMKRTWNTNYAYTQYVVGDWGKVYRVGQDGYVSWGAGSWGNANAPVQVELARTTNPAQFKVDYAVYVNLLRDSARKFGISTNLDTGYGIVTHRWITDNVWGDHVDPYGYLASQGISKAQFAQDLKTGLPENGSGSTTKPSNPVTPPSNNKGGSYRFNYDTVVKSGSVKGPIVATYKRGQTVNYDSTVQYAGYTWMSYISYSGVRRYIAMTGRYQDSNIPAGFKSENGHFKNGNVPIQVRVGQPGLKAKKGGKIPARYTVSYDSWKSVDGYIWVHYKGNNGSDLYLPTHPSGTPNNTWGTFY